MHSGAPTRRIAPMAEALNSTPAADGFSMPAEYAPHECTWMLWPHRADTWRDNGAAAQQAYAAMAAAIAEAEPLKMGVRRSQIEAAKALLPSSVEIIGNMMRTLPKALARRMARNWTRNTSSRRRQKRIARIPRNGFNSTGILR